MRRRPVARTDIDLDMDATCRAECFSPGSDTIGTCACACVRVRARVRVRVHACGCVWVHACMWARACAGVHLGTCLYVCVCVRVRVRAHLQPEDVACRRARVVLCVVEEDVARGQPARACV